jgi:hypothetical protein
METARDQFRGAGFSELILKKGARLGEFEFL